MEGGRACGETHGTKRYVMRTSRGDRLCVGPVSSTRLAQAQQPTIDMLMSLPIRD